MVIPFTGLLIGSWATLEVPHEAALSPWKPPSNDNFETHAKNSNVFISIFLNSYEKRKNCLNFNESELIWLGQLVNESEWIEKMCLMIESEQRLLLNLMCQRARVYSSWLSTQLNFPARHSGRRNVPHDQFKPTFSKNLFKRRIVGTGNKKMDICWQRGTVGIENN